ncbi:vomeronasal type-1 receptor 4-like [Sarcophilus harrisii]|uniref:vomeronasal type-1 receptor 4-like n=1 Tax=Sarcophilus harrisii TaxID=9305 RepID=UPI000273C141|nr:vomeronasal type-1 receptor 4-like [Sarcophilus harrisii]
MIPRLLLLGTIFLLPTAFGVLGSSVLLCLCSFPYLTGRRWRSVNLIIIQLTLANTTLLLSRSIPMSIAVLRTKYFLNDLGCKTVLYLQCVSRDLSICTTCLLSCFQASIISPSGSLAARIKTGAPTHVLPSCLLCWLGSLFVDIDVPIHVMGLRAGPPNQTEAVEFFYCSWEPSLADYVIVTYLRDAVLVGLMVWTSGYMVILLRKHSRQVQYLHRISLPPRASPEIRASISILLLMSSFLSFYFINSCLELGKRYLKKPDLWLHYVSTVLMLCFPAISPFVLLSGYVRVPESCCVMCTGT